MKDNRNLGQSFEKFKDDNPFPKNPMLIHRIQDNLLALKSDSLFAQSLRDNAKDKPRQCVQMILDQYADNPQMIKGIVGKDTLKLIEEYANINLADDLKEVL